MSKSVHDRRSTWWRTAETCSSGDNCVQVDIRPGFVLVRDSKDPAGPVLAFFTAEWQTFVMGVQAGEFDCPEAEPAA